MITRNKILFKGSSHTIGKGLELQTSKRYNDKNWLLENGVILPNEPYTKEDIENQKKYRWPKIVCEKLGVEEKMESELFNGKQYGLREFLVRLLNLPSEKLSDVSHIIFEPQSTRFFHDNETWTPSEMLLFLDDKSIPESSKKFIYDWLDNFDENVLNGFELLKSCIEKHKDVNFLFFYFYGTGLDRDIVETKEKYSDIFDKTIYFTYNGKTTDCLNDILELNKLKIVHRAYCYTARIDVIGNQRWPVGKYVDSHASVEAQDMIAENVIRYIKQNI